MSPDQEELLTKAKESIRAARLLLSGGFPGFAASRAYYAMFYLAAALLEGEGLAFSKHAAVIAGFGQQFVKTGRFPANLHRYLIDPLRLVRKETTRRHPASPRNRPKSTWIERKNSWLLWKSFWED